MPPPLCLTTRALAALLPLALAAPALKAQSSATPPAAAASASSPAPAPAPQQVEITGNAPAPEGITERRNAIAGRITIGREELDRMGDQTLGEVLKRLPGVTMGGPPGRGGGVRMRGMGGGYTQILIDGQRMPPGFSLESIAPEQIERIDIMRAPIAEHGTRAIAGTINVILRSDFKRKAHELRFGAGTDGGQPQVGATLQRNGQTDTLGYNLTATLFDNHQRSQSDTHTAHLQADATPTLLQDLHNESRSHNRGLFANARLAWKLGDGNSLELQPFLNMVRSNGEGLGRLTQSLPLRDDSRPLTVPAYTTADWRNTSQWTMGRLMAVGQFAAGSGGKLNTRFGSTLSHSSAHTDRDEAGGPLDQHKLIDNDVRDLSIDWTGKYSQLLADKHSASVGWEVQHNRRTETAATLSNGLPDSSDVDFGATFGARIRRTALYAQDEWEWSRQLSFYTGLRWEGITTTGETGSGALANRSSVVTPLGHLVWKFDGDDGKPGRDQLRASLTRSYRSPNTNQLIGRRQVSTLAPVGDGTLANSPDRPDREGNPQLKPELAWGLELGLEHYLASGGLTAVNLFLRRISDVIGNQTTLQTVSYAQVQRYVSRPVNLGSATAMGLELEAKLRAADLWDTELPLALRANLSLMSSRVDQAPGPHNRLEGQPPYTLNLGADLPLRGTPLTLGGNWNTTPAFEVQQFENQTTRQGMKRQFDAYALWRFSPEASARLSLSNAAPRVYATGSTFTLPDGSTQSADVATQTYLVVNLRAELRF